MPVTTSDDMCEIDVITFIPKHGICSPYNYHSFTRVDFYLPTPCLMCNQVMYPIIHQTTMCVKCLQYCHRQCMRKRRHKCPVITKFRSHNGDSSLTSTERAKQQHSAMLPRSVCGNTASGPNTDMWRIRLKHLVKIAYQPSSVHVNVGSKPEDIVPLILCDPTSFGSIVCESFFQVFMDFDCSDNELLLRHGRECLDVIASAVLCTITTDTKPQITMEVFNLVDRHVLESRNGLMYKRLFSAAKMISSADDQDFFMRTKTSQTELNCRNISLIMDSLARVSIACTGLDKLRHLIESLQLLSQQEISSEASSFGHDDTEAIKPITAKVPTVPQKSIIDADTLLETLQCALLRQVRHCYRSSRVGTCRWHAESRFIAAMIREEEWLLGAEGYALATLQTALL